MVEHDEFSNEITEPAEETRSNSPSQEDIPLADFMDHGVSPSDEDEQVVIADRHGDYVDFLKRYYKDQIDALKGERETSLKINTSDILCWNPDEADALDEDPDNTMGYIKGAMITLLMENVPHDARNRQSIKSKYEQIPVRIWNLPQSKQIRHIRNTNIDQLLQIDGMVKNISEVRARIVRSAWRCPGCGNVVFVNQEVGSLTPPDMCDSCQRRTLNLVASRCITKSAQLMTVQERPEGLRGGQMPESITVEIQDDICGKLTAGSPVKLVGILRAMQSTNKNSIYLDYIMEGVSYEVSQEEYEDIKLTDADIEAIIEISQRDDLFDVLRNSISPDIKGNDPIKEAIVLQLFGGVTKIKQDGNTIRGDIHILVVTDPSCGKSQMMAYIATLAPRAVLTTGGGTSKAGLTAAAVKDEFGDGRWALEAGSMVLADKGILICIDENQKILTNTGLKLIKHIIPDKDLVINKNNKWEKVINYIPKGVKDTLRINLYDGNQIICTPDHKVLTYEGWKESQDLTTNDRLLIPCNSDLPAVNGDTFVFKLGYLLGFGLCDMSYGKDKHDISFSSSIDNMGRSEKIINYILELYPDTKITKYERSERNICIKNRDVAFKKSHHISFTNIHLHKYLKELFESYTLPFLDSHEFCIGFLSAILSTDCCISHKSRGVVITITLSRKSTKSDEWYQMISTLVQMLFQRYNIMCMKRDPDQLQISSGKSYDIIQTLMGPHIVGKNKVKIDVKLTDFNRSSPDNYIDKETYLQLINLPIKPWRLQVLGISSTWRGQIKRKRITIKLARTIVDNLKYLCDTDEVPIISLKQSYLQNPVIEIQKSSSQSSVVDITLDKEPNFWIAGGIVHNCDEFDKMNADDRGAMHGAMEQGIIVVSKAGINATLKSRCSVFAAANPKNGRFDEYVGLAEQINMPPSLLSRFDLIFTMKDTPEEVRDGAIAHHILTVHEIYGKMGVGVEVDQTYLQTIMPEIEPELFRKYVAYAKQMPAPYILPDASKKMEEYYRRSRGRSSGGNNPVSVTTRQLEGIIRLAEASAKARLSPVVGVEDAERAIRMANSCLEGIAFDPETGCTDWDKMFNSTPKSKRDRISQIKEIIRTLCGGKGGITTEAAVFEEVEKRGIDLTKAEEILGKLNHETFILCNRNKITLNE